MKKYFTLTALITLLLCSTAYAVDPAQPFGVVNFSTCVSDSKLGQQEQDAFENLKSQLSAQLEDTEKQLNEIAAKFNDPDYLDGLSPEAEEELKNKFRTLNENLNYHQNQYYQIMNQANMRIVQTLSGAINIASAKIAKDKKLSLVFNKDACFYVADSLDVTKLIITEMDKTFVPDSKKPETVSNSPETKSAKKK